MEHHVLAGYIGLELALQGDLDGGGHLKPGQAGGHARGHVSGAHAGGEGAQGAVGAGVGVGADDGLAGGDQTLFGQQSVLHTHLAHVVEVGDVKALGKLSGLGAQLGGLDVFAGGGVVQHDGDLVLIKNLGQPSLVELRNGHGGGDIVAQHHVQFGLNQLSGLHGFQPGMLGQDFLGHGHSHSRFPPDM